MCHRSFCLVRWLGDFWGVGVGVGLREKRRERGRRERGSDGVGRVGGGGYGRFIQLQAIVGCRWMAYDLTVRTVATRAKTKRSNKLTAMLFN